MNKDLMQLLCIIQDKLEEKTFDSNLTGEQVTCLLTIADVIDETIKEYLE